MKNEPQVQWDGVVKDLGRRRFVKSEHWLIRYWLNGKTVSHKIASTEHLSISHARQIAAQMKLMAKHGIDPRPWMQEQVRERLGLDGKPAKQVTIRHLFERYFTDHARPHCKSVIEIERTYRLHLSHWADRDCASITRLEVQALVTKLGAETGKYAANRVVQLLCAAFNKGFQWELIDCKNPTNGVTEFREESRDRYFSKAEVAMICAEVKNLRYSRTRDCISLLMLTAQRRANVFSMEWDEIDFDEQVWNIPADKMKAGKSHHVPLVPGAMAVLKRRYRRRKSEKWVFPSEWSKSGHLNCISRAWYRLLKKTGIPNARLHDHRRTLASWEVLTGADIAVVGKMLGHSDLRSTQIYARLNLDPVRAAMIRATDAMFDTNEPSLHRRSFRLVRSL